MDDGIGKLRTTKLFRLLHQEDQALADQVTTFVSKVAPVLATTVRHFPFYTRHDALHGYNVVLRMGQVIKAECFEQGTALALKPTEVFLLIAAAYAHDLGMTVFPGEEAELLGKLGIDRTLGWETDPTLQGHLRDEHSRRGGAYIEAKAEELCVPRPLVGALDKMMKAHNLGVTELENELRAPYAAKAEELDVRQLALIVCVADALEFSDTRVIDGVIERVKLVDTEAARTSYRENMKHVCVGSSLAVREDGSIVVSGHFAEADVLALTHRTLDEIENWIQGYCDVDRRSRHPRLLVRPEPFSRNLDFSKGRFERLGVRLNKTNVINLIASNAVWRSNAGIAVRELVQNAVEACRYRLHHSSKADAYEPFVKVTFDRNSHSVTVEDNGCGMSERVVLNNFLTVGSSRAREPSYATPGYNPIARFGIGFWSVFTVAAHASISTAPFEAARGAPARSHPASGFSFDVSLDELRDYTVFRPVTRAFGTSVGLQLRAEVVIDDVYAQGAATILCSEVPVTFTIDGTDTRLPQAVPEVSERDVLRERRRLLEQGVKLFKWRGKDRGVEVTLALAYRLEGGKASFLAGPGKSLLDAIGGYRQPKTAVCGFLVPVRGSAICFDINRIGNFFANCESAKGIEFSIDRQSLQQTPAASTFARGITDLVHAGYREFLDQTSSRDPRTIAALREQAAMHGGNVYDTFTSAELMEAASRYPDLMACRLYRVDPAQLFAQTAPMYVDIRQLRLFPGRLFFIQRQPEGPGFAGRYVDVESQGVLEFAYEAVRSWIKDGTVAPPAYVMTADRLGSMLFDADPASSVRVHNAGANGIWHLQHVDLGRVQFDAPPTNTLAEVQGTWSGTVYSRLFRAHIPNGKPYLFLGRHRVLVETSSPLAAEIRRLAVDNRKVAIAKLIADLLEDEQGYTADELAPFLR